METKKTRKKWDGNVIIFGNDVQNKMIIFVSYIGSDGQNRIKYIKKYFTFNMYYCQTCIF